MSWLAVALCGVILSVLVLRAIWIMRREGNVRPRGIDPGEGYTEMTSEYYSGVGGGSRQVTRVPKDPQEYARAFVPRKDRR